MKIQKGEKVKVRVIRNLEYEDGFDPPVGYETTAIGDGSTVPFIVYENASYCTNYKERGQYILEDNIELIEDTKLKEVNESKPDPVLKPSHYTQGKIEVLDFLEDQKLDFRLSNVIKYTCRAKYKGKELEDLKKAAFYLNRVIKELESK